MIRRRMRRGNQPPRFWILILIGEPGGQGGGFGALFLPPSLPMRR